MQTKLNPNLPIPLYRQLRDVLLAKIEGGEWPVGHCIPTESECMAMYGVSRTTVREALSFLVREGYLSKKQGKGTFVNSTRLVERLGRLTGFAEEMLQQGRAPSAQLIGMEQVDDLTAVFATYLTPMPQWQSERHWVNIKRIRLADQEPIAVEYSYWPIEIAEVLRREDLSSVAFYSVLERHGISLLEAEEAIAAVNAGREDARYLKVKQGTALIEMARLTTDVNHRLIEYTRTRYRGDRYIYRVKLQR